MYLLSSTFTDRHSILSRRDALLRTFGVALRAAFCAWVAVVCLEMAGVRSLGLLLSLSAVVVLAAAILAWRRLSARIMPDAATRLTARTLLGIALALAACAVAGGLAWLLLQHNSLTALSPFMPDLAAPLGGLAVYPFCMRVLRERRLASAAGAAGVVGDVARTIAEIASD